MTITTIGLLRHGQTDWNIDFRLQGTSDIPLNETGIEQAKLAAAALSTDWEALVSSPLDRAVKTAQIVAERLGFEGQFVEPLLLERSFGEAEGLLYDEWREKYPDSLVPGGETLAELEARCHKLLAKLVADFEGKRVLTVSHGALIRKLIKITSSGQFPREGERLGNASLSIIAFDGKKWSMVDYRPQTLA